MWINPQIFWMIWTFWSWNGLIWSRNVEKEGLLKRLLKIALGNFLVKMFIFILLCRVWNSGNMEMIGMRKIVPQYVVNELNKLNLEWEWWRTFLLNISFAWKCKILGVLNFCSVFKSRNVLKQWRGVTC